MPRLGYLLVLAALGVTACEQHTPDASGSSAAPATAAPASSASAPDSAAPPGFTGAPYAASRTYFKLQGAYPPAWLICDGVDRPKIVVVGLPDADHKLSVFTIDKLTGDHASRTLKVGEADPGAGNVYWPLNTPDGADAGYLRAFNPGMIDDPKSATTATFSSVKLGNDITSCRWTANTVVLAVGARRTYQITREGADLVYRTFDYAQTATARPITPGAGATSTPSLEIHGGAKSTNPHGDSYVFENQGYRYEVQFNNFDPNGLVMVTKGLREIAGEPFQAYTVAQ